MTKIEELEQKLDNAVEKFRLEMNECKKALAELKESKKEGKWKPKNGETFWFRNDYGDVDFCQWCDTDIDNWRYDNLPTFKTKEECERYWRFMDAVKEKNYSFSDDDWTYDDVDKYSIYYDYGEKCFYTRATDTERYLGEIYFKTEESAKYIIDNYKEELMEFFL